MKKLMKLEELMKKQNTKIQNIKRKEQLTKKKMNKNKRRQRVHELIKLGALFEIAGLKNENKGLLLGWLMKLPYITKDEEEAIKIIGQKKLDDRAEKNKSY